MTTPALRAEKKRSSSSMDSQDDRVVELEATIAEYRALFALLREWSLHSDPGEKAELAHVYEEFLPTSVRLLERRRQLRALDEHLAAGRISHEAATAARNRIFEDDFSYFLDDTPATRSWVAKRRELHAGLVHDFGAPERTADGRLRWTIVRADGRVALRAPRVRHFGPAGRGSVRTRRRRKGRRAVSTSRDGPSSGDSPAEVAEGGRL